MRFYVVLPTVGLPKLFDNCSVLPAVMKETTAINLWTTLKIALRDEFGPGRNMPAAVCMRDSPTATRPNTACNVAYWMAKTDLLWICRYITYLS